MRTTLSLAVLLALAATSASADPAPQKFAFSHLGLSRGLVLTPATDGGLHAVLDVGVRGCAGEATGPVTRSGDVLQMLKADDGSECRLTITIRNGVATVKEGDCSYSHGGACDFNGRLQAVQ